MKPKKDLNNILQKAIQILQTGNKDLAIQSLSDYCNKQPDNTDIRRDIGIFLQQNKMPFKAEIFYLDALRIDNNQAVVHFNLGIIYQNLNKIEQAINSYRQATEIESDYARAYANLGYLYKQAGDIERCRQACLTAQKLEPEDPQIKHMIAALGIEEAPEKADPVYIKNLYDNYASDYDDHLSVTLKSKVPELIYDTTMAMLKRQADNKIQDLTILDLGCGTGICGQHFSPHTKEMVGVDLSEQMIAEAEKKNIYTKLYASDITEHLDSSNLECDVVISSDVLIYFGDLNNVFKGVYKVLKHDGLFSFSIESLSGSSEDYSLDDSGRYKHNKRHITQLAKNNNFSIISSDETALRQQNRQDVIGRIYVLQKL